MIDFKTIVWLLPIVFMIHDFEEIICFKPWIIKNKTGLSQRFPTISKRFLPRYENLSVTAFSVAVFEEFVLLSVITVLSVLFGNYFLWLSIFMGFFIHLIIHFIQWLILRKYIPAIYTTIISLVYCTLSLKLILKEEIFTASEIILWTFIGFILVGTKYMTKIEKY
jgi:hypothetical protein